MKKQISVPRALIGIALALVAGIAQAHAGHVTSTFLEGVAHLLGVDHLIAAVTVGAVVLFGLGLALATRRKQALIQGRGRSCGRDPSSSPVSGRLGRAGSSHSAAPARG